MRLDNACYVVVQETRQIRGMLGLGPIRKHHGNGADHLHLHPGFAVLLNALFSIPAVRCDFAKKLLVPHHVGMARPAHLQMDEAPIAEFLRPFGHDPWQNVRMAVDFEHKGNP